MIRLPQGIEYGYRLLNTEPLVHTFQDLERRMGLPVGELRFLFNGELLSNLQCCKDLDMLGTTLTLCIGKGDDRANCHSVMGMCQLHTLQVLQ